MTAPGLTVIVCLLDGARVITEQLDARTAQGTSGESEIRARGRIMAFCEADDVVGPRWVEACCKAFVHVDEAVLTGTISTAGTSRVTSRRIGRGTAAMASGFPDAGVDGSSARAAGTVAARIVIGALLRSLRRRTGHRDRAGHAAGAVGRAVGQCWALALGATPNDLPLLGMHARGGA